MNILYVALIWLLGWITIILIRILMVNISKNDFKNVLFANSDKEYIADGNNLFSTGLCYFVGYLICYFINNDILSWIVFILGALFSIPSIFSVIMRLPILTSWRFDKYIVAVIVTNAVNSFVPLLMAFKIYFDIISL